MAAQQHLNKTKYNQDVQLKHSHIAAKHVPTWQKMPAATQQLANPSRQSPKHSHVQTVHKSGGHS